MITNKIWRFATVLLLSLTVIPVLFQSCVGQENDERKTAESLFADSLRPKTKLKPLVQPRKPPVARDFDPSSDDVFVNDEQMPYFPGGERALLEFIRNNLRMPIEAAEAGIQGRIVITFIIEKNGSCTRFKIVKRDLKDKNGNPPTYGSKLLNLCEQEALRVLRLMPRWEPGKQNGEPVRVKYTVPIKFDESIRKPPLNYK